MITVFQTALIPGDNARITLVVPQAFPSCPFRKQSLGAQFQGGADRQ